MKKYVYFFATPLKTIPSSQKGVWHNQLIGVFGITEGNEKEQVGEYERNYPEFYHTFYPFKIKDEWLALYSPIYNISRLMSLPGCKDIGGETSQEKGFCPVDFYVPRYRIGSLLIKGKKESIYLEEHSIEDPAELSAPGVNYSEILYYAFGFVAGCQWGDDMSWKVQYLDLRAADQGILKREEKFGRLELPKGIKTFSEKESSRLRDYIYIDQDGDLINLEIARVERFQLTNKETASLR